MADQPTPKRKPTRGKGEGTVTRDKTTGLWRGALELPPHAGGGRRRKWVSGKTRREAVEKLDRMREELRNRGDLPTNIPTVEQWFTYWVEQVAANDARPSTLRGYRSVVKNHIIPGLGAKLKLDKITPNAIRRVHASALGAKGSSTYALNAHRVMAASFEVAIREGRIGTNPAKRVKPPKKDVPNLDVLTVDEAKHLAVRLRGMDDGARWLTSLFTGARRGEVIGLEWDRVGTILDLSWQLQRITWSHGCERSGGKWACGFSRAASCPDRALKVPADYDHRHLEGGLYLTRPKSNAGWRIIPLVNPLRDVLAKHREQSAPNPHGLVFARPDGRPRDPDQDTAAWNAVLQAVFPGRNVRLHDVRHGAADLLYEAGVPEDLIVRILGHSTRAMSRAYASTENLGRLTAAMEQMSAPFLESPLELPDVSTLYDPESSALYE